MAEDADWSADLQTGSCKVRAGALRYVEGGTGPTVVLIHTLRTQLEMFHKVVPGLLGSCHVIAVDLPGHGHSARPVANYTADFLTDAIGQFLSDSRLEEVTIVGESIGAGVALLLASRGHDRVKQVVAINPYDYDRGRGVHRSGWIGRMVFSTLPVPVVGPMLWGLRSLATVRMVIRGGVTSKSNLPGWLAREIYASTRREGDPNAFLSLVKNLPNWEAARERYPVVDVPVDLVYGAQDWSHPDERTKTKQLLNPRTMTEVEDGGHFLSLDRPEVLRKKILGAVTR